MSDSSDSAKSFGSTRSKHKKHPRAKCVPIDDSSEICRVGVRMPPFWPDDPEVWFAQVEAQFAIANITSDTTKFNYVMGNLDHQYAKHVRDVFLSPPSHDKFEKLKLELIKRLSTSHEKKVKQLLMHEELGDRKPSQFLRHLQGLAGTNIPEDFLRTIWSSRLPSNVQTLLASQRNVSLEALADLADRVQDIVTPCQVAASSAPGLSMQAMASEIAELKNAVKELTLQLNRRPRSQTRTSEHQRRRSKSSHRKHPLCFYHSKFGANARKCIEPCDYQKPENPIGSR